MSMKRSLLGLALIPAALLVLSACSTPAETTTVVAQPSAQTGEFTPEPLPPIPMGTDEKPSPQVDGLSAVTTQPSSSSPSALLGRQSAVAIVEKSYPEGSVASVVASRAGGYSAWAVTINMPSGGAVVGFVDRATGVVYQWKELLPPVNANEGYDDEGHEKSESSDHEKSESSDHEKFESDGADD